MKKDEFRIYLKNKGKKSHVIDGLISHVSHYEKFLKKEFGKNLERANYNDLNQFIEETENTAPELVKKYCRGISLYYKFCNNDLYKATSGYRESLIEKSRTDFPLKKFQGIVIEILKRLEKLGIKNVSQMLAAGRTEADRKNTANRAGIPIKAVLELVKLSDLSRIKAVKGVIARLYYDAGIDSVEKLARWIPLELREFISQYIISSGFEGIAPQLKEITGTINDAKKIKPVVEY